MPTYGSTRARDSDNLFIVIKLPNPPKKDANF